jgi:hypothetical protein
MTGDGLVRELEAAAALFQEGQLTQQEYDAVKRRILSDERSADTPEATPARVLNPAVGSSAGPTTSVVYVDTSEAREVVARGNRWGWAFLVLGGALLLLRILAALN